jgi:P-type Ca2+ transporter type 2C
MGDRIPADIRITEAIDLEIDESSLTGETNTRKKTSETCAFEQGQMLIPVALADRNCVAFMGTLVRAGEWTYFYCQAILNARPSRQRNGSGNRYWDIDGIRSNFLYDARCTSSRVFFVSVSDPFCAQVEEKRTPLQNSMDELAKKLSIASFGIIGIICLIGVLQQRSWLDMFTIGGM